MEIKKTALKLLIYYFPAGLVFIVITIAAIFSMDFAALTSYLFIPALSLILGFWAGGVDSYIKWGFPVYIALLAFCFEIIMYQAPYYVFILLPSALSLAGVTLRHFIRVRRRRRWK